MAVSFCEIYHKVTNFVLWIFNIFATKARDIIFLDISRRKNFDFVCFMAIVQLYRYNVWFSIIKNTFIIKSEFILHIKKK